MPFALININLLASIMGALLLQACSSTSQDAKKIHAKTSDNGIATISDTDSLSIKNSKNVIIDSNLPMPTVNPVESDGTKGATVVALAIMPGLYRTPAAISFIRCAETHGLHFHLYTGFEMGAVLAAMAAFEISPDKIEWIFYKFMQKTKNFKAYSPEWLLAAREELLGIFVNKKIEDAPKTLLLPVYDRLDKKVIFLKKGALVPALEANLRIYPSKGSSWSSAATWDMSSREILTKNSADKIIRLEFFDRAFEPKVKDVSLSPGWKKIWGISLEGLQNSADIFISLPLDDGMLDEALDIPHLFKKTREYCDSMIEEVKSKVSF